MKKTLILLIMVTLATKVIGFLREILLAYFYGTSGIADAYLISLTIPTVIFALIGTGIKTVFIPIYASILNSQGKEAADSFTKSVLNLMILISSAISLVVLIFTTPVVKIFASGFEGETLSLAITLTQISVFSVYFIGFVYVFQGYLQINGRIVITAMISLPMNIIVMLSFPIGYYFGPHFLAVGKVLAVASQVIFLVPSIKHCGLELSPDFGFKNRNMRQLIYLITPVILGSSVNQINKLIDRTLASQILIGGISAMNYASRLNLFVKEVFVLTISTVLYPSLAKLAINNDITTFKRKFSESTTGVMFFVIPISVATIFFSKETVAFLYGRGSFDEMAIHLTSGVLFYYALGMLSVGIIEILSKVFYCLHDTKTPMIHSAIGLFMNIILNLILSHYMGLNGLALATSIAAAITMSLLIVSLHRKIGSFNIHKLFITFIKLLSISIIVCYISKVLSNSIIDIIGKEVSLVISLFLAASLYVIVTYFARIEGVKEVLNQIRKHLLTGSKTKNY